MESIHNFINEWQELAGLFVILGLALMFTGWTCGHLEYNKKLT